MTSPAIPSSRRLLVAAWGGLALGAAALLALLIQFWGARPEYADRFLILLGAAWVAWNKRATIPSARPHAWLALPLALLAGMLFPMATFLQTQAATFAARLKGQSEPLSTLFYLPLSPNVTYSAALMSKAEETFLTGKAPYPVERTLLTSGLVAAGLKSLALDQKRIETPHLAIRYTAPRESTFSQS